MLLSSLLPALSGAQILSLPSDPEIAGITCDSRQVQGGFIFVAIPGALTDGHLYIDSAVSRGAAAIILEETRQIQGVSLIQVPSARQALAELSRAYYKYPDRHLYMIGVTATNGKTTTTSMVHHLLSGKGVMTAVIGSVAYRFGNEKIQSSLTTPESSDLHAMFARQVQAGVEVVAMEVSSIAEAQCRVYGIEYDSVAFLNITPDHLPDHGSFEAYYEAKAMLVRQIDPGKPVLLNLDEPLVSRLAGETQGQVITFAIEDTKADVGAENLTLKGGIPHFDLVIRCPLKSRRGEVQVGRWPVSLRVPGRHTVYNALAALTLAILYGLDPEEACQGLASFPGVERRLQIIYQKDYTVIDDHISDEDNTRKMLEALEIMTEGRPVHLVYAVRGSRGLEVNREVIDQFALFHKSINWKTFLVTDSRDTARPRDQVLPEEHQLVMDGLLGAGYTIDFEPDLEDAITRILPLVGEGDFLILAGSHNMDKGARIALNLIAAMSPEEERASILKPLEDRMMG